MNVPTTFTKKAVSIHSILKEFSNHISGSEVHNEYKVPKDNGLGWIKTYKIEPGFSIGYYHLCLNSSLNFNWISKHFNEQVYKLGIELHPKDGNNVCPFDFENETVVQDNCAYLYSSKIDSTINIPANSWYNSIALIFSESWLKENFEKAYDEITQKRNILLQKKQSSVIKALLDLNHNEIVKELMSKITDGTITRISIKLKSLQLINDFLEKIVNPKTTTFYSQKHHFDQMQKVEKGLQEYFDKPFPNLNVFAKDYNMSTATLKRHFKIVYGKSIHQYYLEKKLAIGKEMISTKRQTISEVAYFLGYNKINSFSKIFKKHYGILPKEMNAAGLNYED